MRTADELLREHGITLRRSNYGEHTTTCPRCSATRKSMNRRKPCLSVKVDQDGICFICHHCGWSGGDYYEHGKGPKPFARGVAGTERVGPRAGGGYGALQRQASPSWKK